MRRATLLSTTDLVEIQAARDLLEASGIQTFAERDPSELTGVLSIGAPIHLLLVHEEDLEKSKQIIREGFSAPPAFEEAVVQSTPVAVPLASASRSPWWRSGWLVGALAALAVLEGALLVLVQSARVPDQPTSGRLGAWDWSQSAGCTYYVWRSTGKLAGVYCDRDANGISEKVATYDFRGRLLSESVDVDQDAVFNQITAYDALGKVACSFFDDDGDSFVEREECFGRDGERQHVATITRDLPRDASLTEFLEKGARIEWRDEDRDGTWDFREIFGPDGKLLRRERNGGIAGCLPVEN